MSPQLIIFDWDGTLADTTAPIIRTMQAAFQECGWPPPADEAVKPLIGNSLAGIIARLLPEGDAAQQAEIARAYSLSTLNPNNQNVMLCADALPCLDALKQKGYWLAVATGKGRSGLDGAIAQTGTASYWLATRCASECPPKPAPDMVLELCDELGVAPANALVIGDTTYDLDMAAYAGCRAVAVSTGAHTIEMLSQSPHMALLSSLSELPALLDNL